MFNDLNCLNVGLEGEISVKDNTTILATAHNIPLWHFSDNYENYNNIIIVAAMTECNTSYQKN